MLVSRYLQEIIMATEREAEVVTVRAANDFAIDGG